MMPRQPAWDRPQWRQIANPVDKDEISALLEGKGLHHLQVLSRGKHLVIYSQEDGDKVPRTRFTRIGDFSDNEAGTSGMVYWRLQQSASTRRRSDKGIDVTPIELDRMNYSTRRMDGKALVR